MPFLGKKTDLQPHEIVNTLIGGLFTILLRLLDARVLIVFILSMAGLLGIYLVRLPPEDLAKAEIPPKIVRVLSDISGSTLAFTIVVCIFFSAVVLFGIIVALLLRRTRMEGTEKAKMMDVIDSERQKSRALKPISLPKDSGTDTQEARK